MDGEAKVRPITAARVVAVSFIVVAYDMLRRAAWR